MLIKVVKTKLVYTLLASLKIVYLKLLKITLQISSAKTNKQKPSSMYNTYLCRAPKLLGWVVEDSYDINVEQGDNLLMNCESF